MLARDPLSPHPRPFSIRLLSLIAVTVVVLMGVVIRLQVVPPTFRQSTAIGEQDTTKPAAPRKDQQQSAVPAWQDTIRAAHQRFKGQRGTLAQFGDSIFESRAFWTPLRGTRQNATPEMEQAYQRVERYLRKECWREWKGPEFGNQSAQTIEWADKNVNAWLKNLNPEVALIMFGSNDVRTAKVEDFESKLREVVRRCLAHGTVPILATIPPRHGYAEQTARFADAIRKVARDLKVPLVDYHAEILKRRADDWDGAADTFREFEGYEVTTLLSRDGVHPSAPKRYQDDYSDEGLRSHGYGLLNYLTLLRYDEVLGQLPSR